MHMLVSLLLCRLAFMYSVLGISARVEEEDPEGFQTNVGMSPSRCQLSITDPMICKSFFTKSASVLYETIGACVDALEPSCMIHIVIREVSYAVCPDYPTIIKANKFPSEYTYELIQLYLVEDDTNQDAVSTLGFGGNPLLPNDSIGIGVDNELSDHQWHRSRVKCKIQANDRGVLMGIVGQPSCGFSSSTLITDATSGGQNPILIPGANADIQSNYAYYLEFAGCIPDLRYLKTWASAMIPGRYVEPEGVRGSGYHLTGVVGAGLLFATMLYLI